MPEWSELPAPGDFAQEATDHLALLAGVAAAGVSNGRGCSGRLQDATGWSTFWTLQMLSGDCVLLRSVTSASWRLLIQAPARPAHQPGSIAPVLTREMDEVLADVSSQRSDPDYLTAFSGEPIVENLVFGGIPNRDSYRVSVSCAGPAPIEVAFDHHEEGL